VAEAGEHKEGKQVQWQWLIPNIASVQKVNVDGRAEKPSWGNTECRAAGSGAGEGEGRPGSRLNNAGGDNTQIKVGQRQVRIHQIARGAQNKTWEATVAENGTRGERLAGGGRGPWQKSRGEVTG